MHLYHIQVDRVHLFLSLHKMERIAPSIKAPSVLSSPKASGSPAYQNTAWFSDPLRSLDELLPSHGQKLWPVTLFSAQTARVMISDLHYLTLRRAISCNV